MKVTYRKHFILNRRERRRISRFPPSRYCDCLTAPIKFGGLCHVVCLFVFAVSSDETSFKAVPYQNAWVAINNLVVPGRHGYAWIKTNPIKDSFSFLHFIAYGAGRIAKLIPNRNTFEDLRFRHEFYQHPARLLREETRLLTLFFYKVHV